MCWLPVEDAPLVESFPPARHPTFVRNADDTPAGPDKHCAVSGELSGRVELSQLPAPGPELDAICKGLYPLPI
jgi:hypothetical protein